MHPNSSSESKGTRDVDTVVVGGGQSGLVTSYLLTQAGREHVVFDRQQEVGDTWRQRWDSFTLVTPNWTLQLPGHAYSGEDPDGFATRDEVIEHLQAYADRFDPPLRFGVTVTEIRRGGDGFVVDTTDGAFKAKNVVVAAGAFQSPKIPGFSHAAPDSMHQLHTRDYENPDELPGGGVLVVGSGQSGCQIGLELHESGRDVFLCVGSAKRLPRRYRGRDGMEWADRLGIFDQTVEDLDSPAERFDPNPHVSGRDGGMTINLHQFARDGITLLSRLEGFQGNRAILADDLYKRLEAADTMAREFMAGVDKYVGKTGLEVPEEDVDELQDGFDQPLVRELDLHDAGVGTVLWATGYDRDYGWVDLPVFDEYGYPVQEQGVAEQPGLYFVGLHWLHTLKSGLFYGVGEDARRVVEHIESRET